MRTVAIVVAMTVTDIIEYNKTKVLVRLDGHLVFPIYKKELNRFHIKADCELPEQVYQELLGDILPKRAKRRAMYLLTKRDYSTAKLRQKLLEDHYPEEIMEQAIEYVQSFGYLDDERYACQYIRSYCEHKSRRRIEHDLISKGIASDIIENAWEQLGESDTFVDEERQIRSILANKHFDIQQADYKETVKIMNFLYRKGYNPELIHKVVHTPEVFE